MLREDMEKLMRVYIMGVLVAESGKQLSPDIIGKLTSELVSRVFELMDQADVKQE